MAVTPNQAEQAAGLLDVDVWDLMHALHDSSAALFKAEASRVYGWEHPNFGTARRLLRAADALGKAYDEATGTNHREAMEAAV